MRVLSGEADAGEDSLDTAIGRGYDGAQAHYWRGRARLDRKQYAGAETDFTAAIQKGQADAEVYFHRGNARVMQGQLRDAAADLDNAIAKGHEPRISYCTRAFVNYNLGLVDETYRDCSEAISRGVEVAELYRMRAHAAARSAKLEQAEADCIKSDHLEPGNPAGQACWGELHMGRGDFGKAVDAYRAAIDAEDSPRWRFAIALALLLDGRTAEAQAAYKGALATADADEMRIARVELDHWTSGRPEVAEAANSIRPLLGAEQAASGPA